jgi:hypothetical protein
MVKITAKCHAVLAGIRPAHVLETRALVRLYKALLEERTSWQQRVHATLFPAARMPGAAQSPLRDRRPAIRGRVGRARLGAHGIRISCGPSLDGIAGTAAEARRSEP